MRSNLANRIKKINIDNFSERYQTLSPKEKRYFNIMKAQSGVLFITAAPGLGKSAIARSIATKLGMEYIDLRLSLLDETDVGLFPKVSNITATYKDPESGEEVEESLDVLDHVVPKWAILANQRPTLVHFEELNRAPLAVRNAALQLLLERTIGAEFAFNSNVFMMSSGNLGDEDGTDVEVFDRALNNRLIQLKHDLTPKEWIKWFAKENVHPDIVDYIEKHPTKLYQSPKDEEEPHPTPRSWTFLSDYILNNYGEIVTEGQGDKMVETFLPGKDSNYLPDLENFGSSYIGQEILSFIDFLSERIKVNVNDILNNFKSVRDDVISWREQGKRDRYSEIIHDLKAFSLTEMSNKQIDNVIEFLKLVSDDELSAYIIHLLDDRTIDPESPALERLLIPFADKLEAIDEINDHEVEKATKG